MNHSFTVENENIKLEPMSADDSERYRVLRNREDNAHFFFSNAEISQQAQRKWYEGYLTQNDQLMFSVYEEPDMRWIGGIGIYDIDTAKGCAEVGRIIIDRYIAGGKHYGSQAIQLISRLAKERLELKLVYAHIYSSNIASMKSFLNAGYQKTGTTDDVDRVELSLK